MLQENLALGKLCLRPSHSVRLGGRSPCMVSLPFTSCSCGCLESPGEPDLSFFCCPNYFRFFSQPPPLSSPHSQPVTSRPLLHAKKRLSASAPLWLLGPGSSALALHQRPPLNPRSSLPWRLALSQSEVVPLRQRRRFVIPSLTEWLFTSVWFNFHILVGALDFFLLGFLT